jgi:3-deoxy-D-manno-octulosonic-acid transferase
VQGKYRTGWRENFFGAASRRDPSRPAIWLHAVSVGEVLQLQPLAAQLRDRFPEHDLVISTTTVTGHDVARQKFPEDRVIYFPLDFTWAVERALESIRPATVLLVELELWPNFLAAASRRGIPVMLVNGRISEQSWRGYRKIHRLVRTMLRRLHTIAVQNETYAERLLQLGAEPTRLHVTGSIKFDRLENDRRNSHTQALRREFGLGVAERIFIAGSTQAPEEQFAIETYLQLRPHHPELRLILVPRHRERFDEVARLVTDEFKLPLLRRSRGRNAEGRAPIDNARQPPSSIVNPPSSVPPPILLLDTLGELSACWGLADIAFVGGSLTNRGGQNMMEPAAYGAAVLFGPNTRNFRDVVEMLLLEEAAQVVQNQAEMTACVGELLRRPEHAAAMGERARSYVLAQRGATATTVDLIERLLATPRDRSSEMRPAA